MKKDWTGNKKSTYITLGSSSHSNSEREENDYYATPDIATIALIENESFVKNIFEPCCGEGHISKVLNEKFGFIVKSQDLINRGFGDHGIDFLNYESKWSGDIITNPPYKYSLEFLEKSLSLINEGSKIAFLLRIQFLEGKKRRKFFDKNPIKKVLVFSSRIICEKNGNFTKSKGLGGATCFAWFIWEKGYSGKTTIDFIL